MIIGSKVNLRDKKLSDARQDYHWQTDPDLAELDAAPLLSVSFAGYLLDYTAQLHNKNQPRHMLAVETIDGVHIGNCTYYNVDDKRREAEVGIVLGDRGYWDKGYGQDALLALVRYVFLNTATERIHLKTLDWNERAMKCFQKCGFSTCGRVRRDGYSFVMMELHRRHWVNSQEAQLEKNG
ncbi:GNAT family N-acetyltransferase [Chloroflexota bacterium]